VSHGHGRGRGVEELMSRTGQLFYALFHVCIALKNIWFFRPSEVNGIMDNQRRSAFTPNGNFFARMEVSSLCFVVLSMVLRLDAEHIENKPNVGRRRVY